MVDVKETSMKLGLFNFKIRNLALNCGVHLYNNSQVYCEKIYTPGLDFRGGKLEEFARLATLFSIFD